MKISTRGRYALRVMIDLVDHSNGEYVPLKEIAERQNISLKYVESIMTNLSKHNLVIGKHGAQGGYKLAKDSKSYTALEILEITEGSLAPVGCLDCKTNKCEMHTYCKTLPMWEGLQKLVQDYFASISLKGLSETSERYIFGAGI
ncbi:MAG: Rrf2 family transcriptional regulator [Bacilli bacterium]|nr:Rrf2 family transcriptional regulator [Bacilli bacterium]